MWEVAFATREVETHKGSLRPGARFHGGGQGVGVGSFPEEGGF